jgi:hypothetical protein
MPVILATQEEEIRRITVWSQPGQFVGPYFKETIHNKGLVELLKEEAWVQTPILPPPKITSNSRTIPPKKIPLLQKVTRHICGFGGFLLNQLNFLQFKNISTFLLIRKEK